jgi:hypothetical protein
MGLGTEKALESLVGAFVLKKRSTTLQRPRPSDGLLRAL